MTDSNKTAVALVIDRSGSMGSIRLETENSINQFLDEQKALDGELLVHIVDFDTEISTQVELTDAGNVDKYVLQPRGLTALHDEIGKTIVDFGARLAALPEDERPGKVLFVTVTDGGENASQEYKDIDVVKRMVEEQTNTYSWDFVFLGANQDAVLVGQSLGHSAGSSLTYDPGNIAVAASALSSYTTTYRGKGSASFKDSDRQAAVDSSR